MARLLRCVAKPIKVTDAAFKVTSCTSVLTQDHARFCRYGASRMFSGRSDGRQLGVHSEYTAVPCGLGHKGGANQHTCAPGPGDVSVLVKLDDERRYLPQKPIILFNLNGNLIGYTYWAFTSRRRADAMKLKMWPRPGLHHLRRLLVRPLPTGNLRQSFSDAADFLALQAFLTCKVGMAKVVSRTISRTFMSTMTIAIQNQRRFMGLWSGYMQKHP